MSAAVASSIDDSATSQLVDNTHQLGDLQKKLGELQSKGQLAKAGRLSATADCGFEDPSQVFLPWGDLAGYSLIPQGDLNDTSEWELKNVTHSDEQDPVTNGAGSLLFKTGAASQQRAVRPSSVTVSGGAIWRQRSNACEQRGAKEQPCGNLDISGGCPSIAVRRSRSSLIRGIEFSSASV